MTTEASSSSTSLHAGFDPDIDSLLDFETTPFTPSAESPLTTKSIPTFSHRPSIQSSASSFASSQSQQTFPGPTFQYESYKQQTSLPVGGLANTFAINQASGMQFMGGNHGFVMPTETLNIPLSNLDDFDFSRHQSVDMSDIDFDVDSPSDLPTMFYPSGSSAKGQYINPNALVGQDDSPTYSAPVQRMYPGMHSQQAKAQQAQKQQQEMLRQQQQRQAAGQRALPSQQKAPKDPHMEESISRLLSRMRQNSVAQSNDDSTTQAASTSNISRSRKDEDEMDEDERLLASEEGKKLSSKERRQLRNKVSARAFRSRRKEYIGQLEAEVAAKAEEANNLRAQNRQLMEENSRLTDLTRMLLSSPSFSGFLHEISASGLPTPPSTTSTSQIQSQPPPQPTRKDVNPHQAVRQVQGQQLQIGMALIPESAVDFSMLDIPANNWTSSLPTPDFQVFAVTSIPEGPALDLITLSGKNLDVDELPVVSEPTKDIPLLSDSVGPIVEDYPVKTTSAGTEGNVDVDGKDDDLYSDTTHTPSSKKLTQPQDAPEMPSSKESSASIRLVVGSGDPEADALARLKKMCASLDATCERIASFLPHLS